MATRHNLCANPAVGVNVTGWGGASTPVRTAVTGFIRSWAARWTTGTFMFTQPGVATVGLQYTGSIQLRAASFNVGSGLVYLEWLNSSGGSISFSQAAYTLTAGVVTRISVTATAPANTASVRVVFDGINASVNNVDATATLIAPETTLDTYFDGNSPGATWDGTAENSASTLTDSATITALGAAGAVRVRASAGLLTAVRAAPQAGVGGAIRARAGSGRVQAAVAAPQAGAAGAVRIRASAGTVTAVRHAPLAGAAGAVRLRAGSGTTTAARVTVAAGRPGALRIRAGAGSITSVQNTIVSGASSRVVLRASAGTIQTVAGGVSVTLTGGVGGIRLHAGSGQVTTVQHAPLLGPPVRVVMRAGSGAVSTVSGGVSVTLTGPAGNLRLRTARQTVTAAQQQTLTGATASIRVRPGFGQAVAAQNTTFSGSSTVIRLRAATGTVTAVDLGDGVLLPGRVGAIRLRATSGLIATTQSIVLTGTAGAIRVRSRPGTTVDAAPTRGHMSAGNRAGPEMSPRRRTGATMGGS